MRSIEGPRLRSRVIDGPSGRETCHPEYPPCPQSSIFTDLNQNSIKSNFRGLSEGDTLTENTSLDPML